MLVCATSLQHSRHYLRCGRSEIMLNHKSIVPFSAAITLLIFPFKWTCRQQNADSVISLLSSLFFRCFSYISPHLYSFVDKKKPENIVITTNALINNRQFWVLIVVGRRPPFFKNQSLSLVQHYQSFLPFLVPNKTRSIKPLLLVIPPRLKV